MRKMSTPFFGATGGDERRKIEGYNVLKSRGLWHTAADDSSFPHDYSQSGASPTRASLFSFARVPVYIVLRMSRDTVLDSRQEMLRVAARLFQQQGYDATSMNDIAAALKLSKGGLYHHFQSKDEILFDLMNHAMDLTQERILDPVRHVADPEERLRLLIRLHVDVVLSARDREITVLLHENHPLPPSLRRQINARKKEYIHFLETLIAEVQEARQSSRAVSARAATFALLGMVNWLYQWYKPEGSLPAEQIAQQYTQIFFAGAF